MTFSRPLSLLLLGLATATAQDATEAPPGVPIPGEVPAPAAGKPVISKPAAPAPGEPAPAAPATVALGDTKITSDINEQKLSGNALAGLYRKYTGRRVIVSSAAAVAEFTFVQEATPQDPLTFASAAELLKKAATIEGFVFVPDEQDPNLDVLTAAAGIKPTQRGVAVYNENSVLPEGDAVISYVMTLSYIKPVEAVNTFNQIVGAFGTYGSIAAVPNASAVVITENTSLIRKLIDLKKEIDKPGSVQGTRFITVKYADVTEIAETLTTLLTAQQTTQQTAGIQRAPTGTDVPASGQPPASPGEASSAEAPPIQIVPDPRTNRIFAMGRPVDLVFVEGLIREFDVETSEKNYLRRKLRFLKVSEFLPIAGDAITRAFNGTGNSGNSGSAGNPPGTAGAPQSNGTNNRSGSSNRGNNSTANRSGSNSNSSGSSGFGGGGGGGGGTSDGLNAPETSSAPERLLVGRTFLVADNITNSIVVQGPPSSLEIIGRLLDQIDVKPDQVMISTVIGQLTLNDNYTVGLDYLQLGGDVVGRGGSGGGPILPILNQVIAAIPGTPGSGTPGQPGYVAPTPGTPGQSTFNPGQLQSRSGLQVYGKIGNNLNVYLNALQQKTDFTVLSRPSIFTANNQKGTISSGERIAIPTSSNSFGNTGNASTNIEYQDVVLKLEVIPLVNSDKEITLQIALLSDEQNGNQTIDGAGANGGALTVPRISTREILTTVTVPNNETIVLGGLIISKNNKDKSGIPILSSIPYLGSLFGSTTNNKDRTELMVFMQPSIVESERSLNAVQADMDARYKVSGRARKFADEGDVEPLPQDLPPVPLPPLAEKESTHKATPAPKPASPAAASKKSHSTPMLRK
jgi:general secretion pathway protein D